MAKTTTIKINFFFVVMLAAGCGWMQGGALEPDGLSYEAAVSLGHQAYLAQDMLVMITTRYPSVSTKLRFQPVGPLGHSVAKNLDQLGYRISNGDSAPALVYSLDVHEPHGLHMSVRSGDWRIARLYRLDDAGDLKMVGRENSSGPNRLENVGAAKPVVDKVSREPQFTNISAKESEIINAKSPLIRNDTEVIRRWAVQVMAGQQTRQLDRLKAQLNASGYRAERLEKPRLGLYTVQIRGLKSRSEAEGVLQVQRAGEFKDAFLVEYTEQRQIPSNQTLPVQESSVTNAPVGPISNTAGVTPTITVARCERVEIEAGSLRENVRRLLDQCSYTIGNWRLGADGYVEDWIIQRPYAVVVSDGLSGVLALLKHNYFVEGEVRPFTQTIDFQSAEGVL